MISKLICELGPIETGHPFRPRNKRHRYCEICQRQQVLPNFEGIGEAVIQKTGTDFRQT